MTKNNKGFPGGSMVKNVPANAGDKGSTSGPKRPYTSWGNQPMRHNYRACALEPGGCNY